MDNTSGAGLGVDIQVFDLADEAGLAGPADGVETLPADCEANGLPKRAQIQADGSVILTLLYAVTLRYRNPGMQTVTEDTYSELHFHRLTGADMRIITSTPEEDRSVIAIARSALVKTGLMHRLFDKMDAADVVAAGAVVGFFLGSGRTTGR